MFINPLHLEVVNLRKEVINLVVTKTMKRMCRKKEEWSKTKTPPRPASFSEACRSGSCPPDLSNKPHSY